MKAMDSFSIHTAILPCLTSVSGVSGKNSIAIANKPVRTITNWGVTLKEQYSPKIKARRMPKFDDNTNVDPKIPRFL